MDLKVKLENQNFILNQLSDSEFDLLYAVGKNKKIWEQHPENDRWKKEKFQIFFNSGIKNEFGIYGIFDKSNSAIIGTTRFYSYNEMERSVKIGFTFLTPEQWGTNTNFQIKKMMLGHVFNYVEKVYFDIGKNNIRSRKAIEKIGAILHLDTENANVVYILRVENLKEIKL